jgi:hypothetical protein
MAPSDPDSAAGFVVGVPRGAFPSAPADDVVFLSAAEVRAVASASVKRRLGLAGPLGVGVAVVDGRVIGYLDVSPAVELDGPCIVAVIEHKGEVALFGARVLGSGRFPTAAAGRGVEYGGATVPVVQIAQLSARVEELAGGKGS